MYHALILTFFSLQGIGLAMSTTAALAISAQEFASRVSAGDKIELIDVRTPLEFREAHISFARNIPLDQLDPKSVMQARAQAANRFM